ncbi:MAG: hypothetical protein V3T58_07815 [Candidatus Hydrothermarchaeales archaeon]
MTTNERLRWILKKLKSRNTEGVNQGIELVHETWQGYIAEKWGQKESGSATRLLQRLLDELLILARDPDWRMRYAALRALRVITLSDAAVLKTGEIAHLLLESLRDNNGRVRYASVHTLNTLRMNFPGDFYVEYYLTLQELYDLEADAKKRRTLDQALDRLYSPYLEDLFYAMGYRPMKEIGS